MIHYVALPHEFARKLNIPSRFLTDLDLPLHIKEGADFIASGHNFEQLTPTKDRMRILPEGTSINVWMRSEILPRVTEFKPQR